MAHGVADRIGDVLQDDDELTLAPFTKMTPRFRLGRLRRGLLPGGTIFQRLEVLLGIGIVGIIALVLLAALAMAVSRLEAAGPASGRPSAPGKRAEAEKWNPGSLRPSASLR
jgi:hypothetical protein